MVVELDLRGKWREKTIYGRPIKRFGQFDWSSPRICREIQFEFFKISDCLIRIKHQYISLPLYFHFYRKISIHRPGLRRRFERTRSISRTVFPATLISIDYAVSLSMKLIKIWTKRKQWVSTSLPRSLVWFSFFFLVSSLKFERFTRFR